MVRLVRFYFLPTAGTAEAVVTGVGVAEADLGFEVPVAAEYPRVAVCHACADEPALVAGVLELAGVRAEKVALPPRMTWRWQKSWP